jgi:CPA1 family monovalent cation:H+ antiporter
LQEIELALALVLGVAVVATLARRVGLPAPILLVVAGLAVGLVPGMHHFRLDPDVVLALFLPPLLHQAALNSSLRDFKANRRPIGLLSIGLVLFSTVAVGLVAHWAVPSMPLAAAFVLGAIVAPPDAVAAIAIGRRAGLPSRVVTILEGESLVNDATALVAYRVAVAAVVTGAFSLADVGLRFLVASVGGVAVGLAAGWLVIQARRRLADDPLAENTVALLAPFAAYLPAEAVGASGVLAVVVAGLYLNRFYYGPRGFDAGARLQVQAVWRMVVYLLEGVIFALIGLQLPTVLEGLGSSSVAALVLDAAVVSAAVIVARIVWVFPAAYLPRLLSRRIRAADPYPPWQHPAVIAWTGMRGVVSLAAALALPFTTAGGAPFPERASIQFLAFCVILATLVLQGLSLPAVIRWLGVGGRRGPDGREEATARHRTAEVALVRLDELVRQQAVPEAVERKLRHRLEERRRWAAKRLDGDGQVANRVQAVHASYNEVRRALLRLERAEAVRLLEDGTIGSDALHRVERELDLEESQLSKR